MLLLNIVINIINNINSFTIVIRDSTTLGFGGRAVRSSLQIITDLFLHHIAIIIAIIFNILDSPRLIRHCLLRTIFQLPDSLRTHLLVVVGNCIPAKSRGEVLTLEDDMEGYIIIIARDEWCM